MPVSKHVRRLLTIFLAGLRRSRRLGCVVPAYAALETPPGSPQPAFADYDPWSDKRGGEKSEEEEEVELLVTEDDESGPLSVRSPDPRPLQPSPVPRSHQLASDLICSSRVWPACGLTADCSVAWDGFASLRMRLS